METKKDIFVLTGSGHKGSVKISYAEGGNKVKVECNLDFRPSGATLYIIGDEIAQLQLNDSKTCVELPFQSKSVDGCVIRSSSFTMLGGRGNKSEMLAKIDAAKHSKQPKKIDEISAENPPKNTVVFTSKTAKISDKTSDEKAPDFDTKADDKKSNNTHPNLAKLLAETSSDTGILKYNGSNFYLAIKPQLDEMFVCYKQETKLNETVGNSSWVHIDTEDGYYVVGLLKDGDTPSYICYGVPSKDENDVPPELKNVCVWLPVEDENIKGYWVIYQSAVNGEIVK